MTFGELKQNKSYTIKSEEFGTIKLSRKRQSSGRKGLSDLRWVPYSIDWTEARNIPESELWIKEYNEVVFEPHQINEEIRKAAEPNVFFGGVNEYGVARPNIDGKTGNIHPALQTYGDLDFNSVEIAQLVLVIKDGPKCNKLPEDVPHYDYYENPEKKTGKCLVPKACYYPLIDENDEETVKDDFGYQFLKKIWEEILKN
ncbi:MAG: hypothetical protein ACI4JS_07200 [Oscillospiraceae bacterium]